MAVKCQPARRKCRPDIVPAQAFVRAGLSCAARVFCCGALPSLHVPDLRFWRGVLPSVHARHCGFVVAFFSRHMPGSAFLSTRLASVHACLFSFVRKKETACDALRSCSAGRDRHSCVLAALRGRWLDCVTWALFTRRGLCSVCGIALLSQRFDFGLRPALRFCCSVFSSAYARLCGSAAASCLRSRLLFVLHQTGRLAVPCVSVPPVEIAICVFSRRCGGRGGWMA